MSTPIDSLIGNADAFPILRHWDFFNHAGIAPIPHVAAEALRQFAREAEETTYLNTGWYTDVTAFRREAASFINAQPQEIAFIKNTSEGIATVANGIEWKTGDRVVTTAIEYPANMYPWMDVARRFGVELITVPEETCDDGARRVPLEKIMQEARHPRTRLVTLSHVEFASGQRHDLTTIGAFCRANGKLLCVDAIQSLGILPVDVQAMNIDYLAADGHKWLLGAEGAGIFYCRADLLPHTRPLAVGWMNVINADDYGHYDFTLRPDAARFECGSWNLPGFLALRASMALLSEVGIDAISARIRHLTEHLIAGLTSKGYTVLSPRGEMEWSGIVSFLIPGKSSEDYQGLVRRLRKEHHIEIALREGRLRRSPHFYNTESQLDHLLGLLPA